MNSLFFNIFSNIGLQSTKTGSILTDQRHTSPCDERRNEIDFYFKTKQDPTYSFELEGKKTFDNETRFKIFL